MNQTTPSEVSHRWHFNQGSAGSSFSIPSPSKTGSETLSEIFARSNRQSENALEIQKHQRNGGSPEPGEARPGEPPSLSFNHNCITQAGGERAKLFEKFPTNEVRKAVCVAASIDQVLLGKRVNGVRKGPAAGLENCGFLTLTLPQQTVRRGRGPFGFGWGPPTHREIKQRFRSLRANVLYGLFKQWIIVWERGSGKGRLHCHLFVDCGVDIRSGFDFSTYDRASGARSAGKRGQSRKLFRQVGESASSDLRQLWSVLSDKLPRYGFGKWFELCPIKSNGDAVSRYIGGYIQKGWRFRNEEDKGQRAVAYRVGCFKVDKKGKRKWVSERPSARFNWVDGKARWYRIGVGLFVGEVAECLDTDQAGAVSWLTRQYGSRWQYHCSDRIGFHVGQVKEVEDGNPY